MMTGDVPMRPFELESPALSLDSERRDSGEDDAQHFETERETTIVPPSAVEE